MLLTMKVSPWLRAWHIIGILCLPNLNVILKPKENFISVLITDSSKYLSARWGVRVVLHTQHLFSGSEVPHK